MGHLIVVYFFLCLSFGLAALGLIFTRFFFLCFLLIFSNILKLRRNGRMEWAIAVTASLAYCIVASLSAIPDPASAVLYQIRQPWRTIAVVVFALIVALTFVPMKSNTPADPRVAAAARRMTIVSHAPAEGLLVDRAQLLTLTAPEMTVLVGGDEPRSLRALPRRASLGAVGPGMPIRLRPASFYLGFRKVIT